MKKQKWKGLALVIVALAVLVTLFAPSGVADERRLVVNLHEPFEINGELYPEGKVTVKSVRTYNPTSVLSEVWVGRDCLGVFRASRVEDDVPTAVKQDRNRRLLAASERVQAKRLRRHLGATRRVFVESESDKHAGSLRGRTEHGLPVRFTGAAELLGTEQAVRIEEASAFGLAGSPV